MKTRRRYLNIEILVFGSGFYLFIIKTITDKGGYSISFMSENTKCTVQFNLQLRVFTKIASFFTSTTNQKSCLCTKKQVITSLLLYHNFKFQLNHL